MSDSKELKKENEVVTAAAETDVKEKESAVSAPDTKSEVANAQFETEIKETDVSDTQVSEEEYEEAEVAKPKKRFKKRYVIIPLVLLGAGAAAAKFFLFPAKTLPTVTTEAVTLGNIENVISISGNVASAETKTIYADVDGTLSEINVKVGDKVKSGDLLYTYDVEKLELAEKQAELAIKQAKGSYSALYAKAPTTTEDLKYAQGMNTEQLTQRIDQITAEIDAINNKITEKTTRMNKTLSDLNYMIANDYNQNNVSDKAEGYDQYSRKDEDGNELYIQTQKAITEVEFALKNDPEIKAWNDQITALKEEQSHLTTARTAQGSSYVNPGNASSTKAQMEASELTNEDKISRIEAAKEGVKADFNAVVASVDAVEGQTVTTGTKTMTLSNLDDVQVNVQVSKSDLSKIATGQKVDITVNGKSYEGEITKISGTATKNSNGVPVVDTIIKIANPDEDIILGVEANNKIHAQKAENTVVLPYECILTDAKGDYVYTVEDGLVTRKDITIGISNSTQAQVLEGLNEGDQVISTNLDTLIEGTEVQTMPEM